MSAPRMVEVDTRDRGLLVFPEPAWCIADHESFNPPADHRPYASEVSHYGEDVDITVNGPDGPCRLLQLLLWQDPFPTPDYPQGSEPHIVVHLLDGIHVSFALDELEGLSADLMEAAGALRLRVRELAAQVTGDAR